MYLKYVKSGASNVINSLQITNLYLGGYNSNAMNLNDYGPCRLQDAILTRFS